MSLTSDRRATLVDVDDAQLLAELGYGKALSLGDARVRFAPAGHVLGSAQVVIEHRGVRVVVSGDYKRRADPTCAGFEPQRCDLFVTEATFALPVFRHPPDAHEIEKLLHAVRLFPERCHLVGVYALGKCQRLIALLRAAGYSEPQADAPAPADPASAQPAPTDAPAWSRRGSE